MSAKNTEVETYFGRCRCCLSYGYLKNMWLEHKYGEETEVYGEMLIQCFALTWNNTEETMDQDQICEQCITRLRDASEFKKVVLDSQEELLLQIGAENESSIKVEHDDEGSLIYQGPESEADTADSTYTFDTAETDTGDLLGVKEETEYEDIEYLEEEDVGDPTEVIDTDSSLPSETRTRPKRRKRTTQPDSDEKSDTPKSKWPKRLPKTERFKTYKQYTADDFRECMETIRKGEMTPHEASLKYNIPKKTICAKLRTDPKAVRTDFQTPLNATITRKGSTWTQSKVQNTCSKEPKLDLTKSSIANEKTNKKTDEQNYLVMIKHKNNLKMVLKYSNATMIKGHSSAGYACCFCDERFSPENLKKHTLKHGDVYEDAIKVKYVSDLIIKIDITGLKCRLCKEDIESLEEFMDHLKEKHKKTVYTDIDNHIIPFKFDTKNLRCVVCYKTYKYFKLLSEHMCEHYRNYECAVCRRPFINKQSMQTHSYRHKKGEFKCSECPKIFDNRLKVNEHERLTHNLSHKKRKCGYCSEKFTSVESVRVHETKMHGAVFEMVTCAMCQKAFKSRKALIVHTQRHHLMVRPYECDDCGKRFYSRQELNWHSATHTKSKKYQCEWCDNAFGTKPALNQHMRAHLGDRRYTCEHCTTAYVHLSTWKAHMLKQHGEKNPKP